MLSQVIGGLYALKGTPVVQTAIKVGERHDANVCILCEGGDHTAAQCEKKSDLPLVSELVSELVSVKAKADARAEEAEKREADAERKAAEKGQEAADARAALVASRSVGQIAAAAAEAAPAPATHCRGVRMTAGGKNKCVERHALTRD